MILDPAAGRLRPGQPERGTGQGSAGTPASRGGVTGA